MALGIWYLQVKMTNSTKHTSAQVMFGGATEKKTAKPTPELDRGLRRRTFFERAEGEPRRGRAAAGAVERVDADAVGAERRQPLHRRRRGAVGHRLIGRRCRRRRRRRPLEGRQVPSQKKKSS